MALSWALLVCALLLAGLVYAVVTAPPPWWILLLAWAPALGVAILGQRLLRALHRCARSGDEPARITREGWEDLTTADAPGFRDPDLGNRMNDRSRNGELLPRQARRGSEGALVLSAPGISPMPRILGLRSCSTAPYASAVPPLVGSRTPVSTLPHRTG
ncbi:hypothetical protein JOD52_001712 [Brachybacterium muris]|uniref:hypothetical protein n=1 Tax=Brachybacterium muris TaxID=219301 RepID=UPI0019581449|nr:hypothetical protein [Brachybacterium muris]MBM7500872.1 hypothetical protein [Brachybacterium muris]